MDQKPAYDYMRVPTSTRKVRRLEAQLHRAAEESGVFIVARVYDYDWRGTAYLASFEHISRAAKVDGAAGHWRSHPVHETSRHLG